MSGDGTEKKMSNGGVIAHAYSCHHACQKIHCLGRCTYRIWIRAQKLYEDHIMAVQQDVYSLSE
jgi:hypothetical protein